jgi:aspartyl-tRNA(Asn)/glutamyl-tRNA(Gln) amidotransferase subunit A
MPEINSFTKEDLCDLSIIELRKLLQKQEISFSAIIKSVENRIKDKEKTINGYISLFIEQATEQAKKLDQNHKDLDKLPWLTGIPIAIKDNICVKDALTTCGSKILSNFVSPYDATVTKRLKENGAIIIGKTNLDEFAMGSSSEMSFYGPVSNPHNFELVPGGSSGGSAAVVAYGGAFAALGSDTGGSVRQPAALCGVAGIKPTYGRVSRYGLVAFASSLDQIGQIGKTVKDCAILLSVVGGLDEHDLTSVNESMAGILDFESDIKNLRIGIPKEYFVEGLDPGVEKAVRNMIKTITQHCACVKEVSLPNTQYAIAAYYLICTAEISSNLARYDAVKYGYRAKDANNLRELYEKTRDEGFGQEVKRRIILGAYGLSKGYYDEYYGTAQKVRTLIRNDFDAVFKEVDVLLTPTTPTVAFRKGEKISDPLTMYLSDIYTVPVSLAGLPAISIPCKDKHQNLPVGLQIIGRPFDEKTVLNVANWLEKI